jgi:hypothetical protein
VAAVDGTGTGVVGVVVVAVVEVAAAVEVADVVLGAVDVEVAEVVLGAVDVEAAVDVEVAADVEVDAAVLVDVEVPVDVVLEGAVDVVVDVELPVGVDELTVVDVVVVDDGTVGALVRWDDAGALVVDAVDGVVEAVGAVVGAVVGEGLGAVVGEGLGAWWWRRCGRLRRCVALVPLPLRCPASNRANARPSTGSPVSGSSRIAPGGKPLPVDGRRPAAEVPADFDPAAGPSASPDTPSSTPDCQAAAMPVAPSTAVPRTAPVSERRAGRRPSGAVRTAASGVRDVDVDGDVGDGVRKAAYGSSAAPRTDPGSGWSAGCCGSGNGTPCGR